MKISIQQSILNKNDILASDLRKLFDSFHTYAINIMASPGAGKTTVINKTVESLKDILKIGVIDGDIVDIDLEKLKRFNIPLSLANTGGNCHLDAVMIQKALKTLDLSQINLLIIENVGNLVCPANFDLGTHQNVVIASVPEGADKPYKYPGMFKGADVVIVNKVDYLEIENFDLEYFSAGVRKVNSDAQIVPLSAKTGTGFDTWTDWLLGKVKG